MKLSKAAVELNQWLVGDGRSQSFLARGLSVRAATVNAWCQGKIRKGDRVRVESRPHRSIRAAIAEKTGIRAEDWETYDVVDDEPPVTSSVEVAA